MECIQILWATAAHKRMCYIGFALSTSRNDDKCRLLLGHGSDIFNRNRGGGTALHTFANPAVWPVLRRCGRDIDLTARDEYGRTILHYLAWSHLTTPDSLRPYCEDPQSSGFGSNMVIIAGDNHGCTPLHLAAQRGNAPVVRYLLELPLGSSLLWARDQAGGTALHHAVQSRRASETIAALAQGVKSSRISSCVRTRDHDGLIALHGAAALQNLGAVMALLALEDNSAWETALIPNAAGVTPLDLMCEWQRNGVALPPKIQRVIAIAKKQRSQSGHESLEHVSKRLHQQRSAPLAALGVCYSVMWPLWFIGGVIFAAGGISYLA